MANADIQHFDFMGEEIKKDDFVVGTNGARMSLYVVSHLTPKMVVVVRATSNGPSRYKQRVYPYDLIKVDQAAALVKSLTI